GNPDGPTAVGAPPAAMVPGSRMVLSRMKPLPSDAGLSVAPPARARLRAAWWWPALAARLARGLGTGPAARRCAFVIPGMAHAQLLAGHPHLLQVLEHFGRHALRQVDQAVIVADVDAADVTAFQVRLVGDRADDVARLHTVHVANLDAEGLRLEALLGRGCRPW